MIKITTDSTCDLPRELLERHHITVIPLGIVKAGKLYHDGVDIHTADIAAHVDTGGEITTTNAVNVADYEELFRRMMEEADAVIHLNIGMGFSSCHQNARLAAEEVDGVYVVKADWLANALAGVNMDDYESLQYFQRVLIQSGIIKKLEDMGINEGDTVSILDFEFEYVK